MLSRLGADAGAAAAAPLPAAPGAVVRLRPVLATWLLSVGEHAALLLALQIAAACPAKVKIKHETRLGTARLTQQHDKLGHCKLAETGMDAKPLQNRLDTLYARNRECTSTAGQETC